MIPPAAQRAMSERAEATVTETRASHSALRFASGCRGRRDRPGRQGRLNHQPEGRVNGYA
jgi:hypothetical protein